MRNRFKLILSIFAGVLSVVTVSLLALPFVLDPNDFKENIQKAVYDNTGRHLTIEGQLELSFFPWAGLSTGKLSLSNAAGFKKQVFAQIDASSIKVKLLPLLSKKIQISEIVLDGVQLNLAKNAQGESNWADLAALLEQKDPKSNNPLKLLQIAGVSLKNTHVSWDDWQTAQHLELKNLHLKMAKFEFGKAVETDLGFSVLIPHPVELTESVHFHTQLVVNEALNNIRFKQLKIQSVSTGKSIPNTKLAADLITDARLDLQQNVLSLSSATLNLPELSIQTHLTFQLKPPFNISGTAHIPPFNARQFITQHLAIALPEMADKKALTWVGADFSLSVNSQQAKLENLLMQVDETNLGGELEIARFKPLQARFKLDLDILNADRYLPVQSAKQTTTETTPEAALAAKADLLPLTWLKEWDMNGKITINDLKISNLTMQGIHFTFDNQHGFLQSKQSIDRLYQGSYRGKFQMDARLASPILLCEHRFSHLQIGELLNDLQGNSKISGFLDAHAELGAIGKTESAIKSSLNGELQIVFKNTLLHGVNLQQIMDNSTIAFKEHPLNDPNNTEFTAFSKISAHAIVSDGLIYNNDLSAQTARIKVSGFGSLDIISEQIHYTLVSVLLKEKQPTLTTQLSKKLPLFLTIEGKLTQPNYQVDLAKMGLLL